uniref:hypothetical protein n=1 Tax=Nonomuraea sp. CA-251285 TaxID=3240002 RepID=UPI003F494085
MTDLERLAATLTDGLARFDELVAAKGEEIARPRIEALERQLAEAVAMVESTERGGHQRLADLQTEWARQRRVLDRQVTDVNANASLVRQALGQVAMAAVTLNADSRAPNDIYHMLGAALVPLCGSTTSPDLVHRDGIVRAVTVPYRSRCNRVGCSQPWEHLPRPAG